MTSSRLFFSLVFAASPSTATIQEPSSYTIGTNLSSNSSETVQDDIILSATELNTGVDSEPTTDPKLEESTQSSETQSPMQEATNSETMVLETTTISMENITSTSTIVEYGNIVYKMIFEFGSENESCADLVPKTATEHVELAESLKTYLGNSVPSSSKIEIVSATCGSLDIQFRIKEAYKNYTDEFSLHSTEEEIKLNWRGAELTLREVSSSVDSGPGVVSSDDEDDDATLAIVLGIIFGILFLLAIAVVLA